MAHQTNVNQVKMDFPRSETDVRVKDPCCGKEMIKREARHVLFRNADPVYFCSRGCLDQFIAPRKGRKAA